MVMIIIYSDGCFDGLKSNGAKWDVIGMSLYPSSSNWSTLKFAMFNQYE